MNVADDLIIEIFSFVPRDEEYSETFLQLFLLSKYLNKTAKTIFKKERKIAAVWVQPSCFWAIGIDSKSIVACIWSFSEFMIRFSNWNNITYANSRCYGGLRSLFVQGHLRKMETSWKQTYGIHAYCLLADRTMDGSTIIKTEQEMKRILVIDNILRPHENLENWNFQKEIHSAVKQAASGKYSKNFKGDKSYLLGLFYCVGELIKEPWSEKKLTKRQQGIIDRFLRRDIDERFDLDVSEDFQKSLRHQSFSMVKNFFSE
eukprot:gene5615-9432_t